MTCNAIKMMFTVASLVDTVLITAFLFLITLCWLSEKKASISNVVWNTTVLLRNACQVIYKDTYTSLINEDPVVEESDLTVVSGDHVDDQTPDSLTADPASPSFPVYFYPSPHQDENTVQTIKEATISVMRVIDLTIKEAQTVEKCINYFEFVFFKLDLGKEMYAYVNWHLSDQLGWWHNRMCDQQLSIVGKLYGALIAQGIRLNLKKFWNHLAWMIICNLESDDVHFANFAQSAYGQLKKDLPLKYSHLIKEMTDKPKKSEQRRNKPVVVPPYAQDYEYL